MKKRIIAILLAFFVGLIGAHKFYLNQNGRGIMILLLTLTGVGMIVTVPWVVLDFFSLAMMSDDKFDKKYN